MSNQYENTWKAFTHNTVYPFKEPNELILNFIVGLTVWAEERIYLKSIRGEHTRLSLDIATLDSVVIGLCQIEDDFDRSQLQKIVDLSSEAKTIGYLEFGPGVEDLFNKYFEINLTPTFGAFVDSCRSNVSSHFSTTLSDPTTGDILADLSGPIKFIEGYNMRIDEVKVTLPAMRESATILEFTPSLGSGLGIYCGEDLKLDAVYTINSVEPDSEGNLRWVDLHFFKLIADALNNKIQLDLTIPEDRLACTRTGYDGPQGWPGARGSRGEDGSDAPEVNITFDYCSSPYKGS